MDFFWKSAFLIMMLFLLSCHKKINTRDDLIAYVNDRENGLVKTQEINKIKVELKYKPWQLMIEKPDQLQHRTGNYLESALKHKYFFVLSLSSGNKELLRQLPFDQYSEMVQVLAFRLMAYIHAVPDNNNNKSVTPEDCLFQQTYGLSRANQVLIVFDEKKLRDTKHLNIEIKEFGLGIGDLNFQMNTNNIRVLPAVALN